MCRARFLLLASALLLLPALTACVPAARMEIDDIGRLASDEAVVVGRVELVPPLRQDEQKLQALNTSQLKNKAFLLTGDQPKRFAREPQLADYEGRIEANFGQTFFVRSKSQPFYVLASMVYLRMGNSGIDQAYLPGNLRVPLRSGDKAVYVGTIRYHRNEFFDIMRVSVVDEYDAANAEYRKKFGSRYPLGKALMTLVN
jgi:hypothetical protein